MIRSARFIAIGLIALGLAACQQGGQKQTLGTLLGAVGGAVAGSQVGKGRGQLVAVAAGTLLGGFLGGEIGKSLDNADRIAMEQNTQRSLEATPSGTTTSWRNPDNGHSGTVTPQPSYQNASGQYCREYEQSISVDGKTETAYGTACRQPDGSWKIVNG
ncbi:MAG: glycine zipper 2TM domain-containing protein [Rhodospirillaceae bacterium]|nr:glycine zipper 2TM domain-containing protein [Rhodospirillaceae bacterium]MBT4485959.1 glycine zipper 2TM domain-containing protein [Rhodospirillaceae bacterium]MBT5195182.1 glycine zipper 2TM domain-containing protein [Rhodospirillaceae bacterium]MBT5898101.1 glycine zipper 2TM domain-containing protein [Rhodospirillaceae bacterium]MBT6428864.1 glycine zipper 2TM domain-containing protein [Rhodospirillaceae bacterium]